MAKPVATSASAPARADSRRCSHTPSPTSPAPSTAPNATRAGGVNQPRDAARASRRTTPSSVTAPPVQASSRAPVSGDRFGAGAVRGAPQAIGRRTQRAADRRAPSPAQASPGRVRARPGPRTTATAARPPDGRRRVRRGGRPRRRGDGSPATTAQRPGARDHGRTAPRSGSGSGRRREHRRRAGPPADDRRGARPASGAPAATAGWPLTPPWPGRAPRRQPERRRTGGGSRPP